MALAGLAASPLVAFAQQSLSAVLINKKRPNFDLQQTFFHAHDYRLL